MSFPRELCTYGGCAKGGSMNTMLMGGMTVVDLIEGKESLFFSWQVGGK